jgi:gamma-glutamyltranspeptidase/glutathione hydrolase
MELQMKWPTSKITVLRGPFLALAFAIVTIECHAAESASPCASCDPGTWPATELHMYSSLQQRLGYRPGNLQIAKSRSQPVPIVVGATEPLAVHAGFKVLESGGTAADAAIATALAQIALSGGSAVSYAGILDAMYFDAASGRAQSLNAGYNTVKDEIEALHTRYGRRPFAELFKPAIWIAEQGVPMNLVVRAQMHSNWNVLSRLPETRAVFTNDKGERYELGDTFRQPALAATLRRVASEGVRYMYSGEWAQRFVAAVRGEGGKMTLDDLATYRAEWSEPTRITYGPYEVASIGNGHTGALITLGALKSIELAGWKQQGHFTESAQSLFELIHILRIHRDLAVLPPDERARVVPGVSAEREQQITKDTAQRVLDFIRKTGAVKPAASSADLPHTSAIVVRDKDGNVAALVHSINTVSWGMTGIFVDGVSIPDSARFQQSTIARVGPGRRVPVATIPLIVLKDGHPVLASGSIGMGPNLVVPKLVSILDFGVDLHTANRQPRPLGVGRYNDNGRPLPASGGDAPEVMEPNAFSATVLEELLRRGQSIVAPSDRTPNGYWVALHIDPTTHRVQAVTSPGLPSQIDVR